MSRGYTSNMRTFIVRKRIWRAKSGKKAVTIAWRILKRELGHCGEIVDVGRLESSPNGERGPHVVYLKFRTPLTKHQIKHRVKGKIMVPLTNSPAGVADVGRKAMSISA